MCARVGIIVELWCSDCKITIVCSKPSLPTSISPPIDLPIPLRSSGPNHLSLSGVRFQVACEVLSCVF
jgi:hypothetical protein